jgi:hypothetical protein
MGFYEQTPSPSSPVLVLQPQHPQPYGMPSNRQAFNSSAFIHESRTLNSWSRSMQQALLTSRAGRKRSRDDEAEDLQDDNYFALSSSPTPDSSEGNLDYGAGTPLRINGFIIDPRSQAGAEKAISTQRSIFVQDRPVLRSFKSQRLEVTATSPTVEQINPSNGFVVALSPSKTTAEDPTIDAFTIHLGIGWSRISEDKHIQAAARGWAKFIENHYPLNKVRIRLQSKGLASYLVQADEGWFLFAEDLRQGRLVSMSLEKTFKNLKSSPPNFDSDEVVVAVAETPKLETELSQEVSLNKASSFNLNRVSEASDAHATTLETSAHGIHIVHNLTGQEIEGEMDMS